MSRTQQFRRPMGGAAAIAYLLRDEFTTARLAGAVNGTAAEPGGTGGAAMNTRTVTDTNNKISITAGGVLNFATGEAANDGLWYGAVTRAAGRVLLGTATLTSGAPAWGWDSNQTGVVNDSIIFGAGSAWNLRPNGAAPIVIETYAAATAYQFAAVMRATGMYWFVKGGAYTNWTLLFMTVTGSANGYPAVITTGATGVFTADSVRVPVPTWLPTPLAYDTFTRANGALGNSESTGPDAQTVTARAWTGATWAIATNAAVNTPTDAGELLTNGTMEADANWANFLTPVTNERSNEQAHAGTYSRKLVGDAINDGVFQNVAVTTGVWYRLIGWVYVTAGTARLQGSGVVWAPNQLFNTASWTQGVLTGRAIGTGTNSITLIQAGVVNVTAYVDDVSFVPLTLSTLFASLTDAATTNVKVRVQVGALTTGTQCGLVARLDSAAAPANFIIMYFDGAGNVKVEEMVAGTYAATVLSEVKAFTASDWLELDLSGTAYRAYHITNAGVATLLGSGTVQTATGTLHGLFSTYSANTVLGMEVWPKGTGNEFSALDAY